MKVSIPRYPVVALGLALLLGATRASAQCIDNDGDGYGVANDPSCPSSGIDCDDADVSINPGVDSDGDGFDACVDCDDFDQSINPGVDSDGDGFDACIDCDDFDQSINPGVDSDGDGFDVCVDCDDANVALNISCVPASIPVMPFWGLPLSMGSLLIAARAARGRRER